jgi:hypothetical protein
MILFWCLMLKGEKLRPKKNGSANHLWILKIEELEFDRGVRIVFLSKYSYCKIWSLMGENFDYGKRGSFSGNWSILLLEYLSMCPNNRVWLRDRKMNLIGKNKPSGGKEWSKYACWGLVLKCYELRTRQHKMLNINVLRPLKHYLPKDLMNFGRRPWARYHEGHTFVIRVIEQCRMKYKKYETLREWYIKNT